MWIGLAVGWVLASASLYAYLIATAREPQRQECMDCRLTDCAACPHLGQSDETIELKRAA